MQSKVRVEGEQKVAELQAVVEELNGKLGTFTQVPTNSNVTILLFQHRRLRRVRLPCNIIESKQPPAVPQRPVSLKSLEWHPQNGMTSDANFLLPKLRGMIWLGWLRGGSRR